MVNLLLIARLRRNSLHVAALLSNSAKKCSQQSQTYTPLFESCSNEKKENSIRESYGNPCRALVVLVALVSGHYGSRPA
jgi:hypothetical protein